MHSFHNGSISAVEKVHLACDFIWKRIRFLSLPFLFSDFSMLLELPARVEPEKHSKGEHEALQGNLCAISAWWMKLFGSQFSSQGRCLGATVKAVCYFCNLSNIFIRPSQFWTINPHIFNLWVFKVNMKMILFTFPGLSARGSMVHII